MFLKMPKVKAFCSFFNSAALVLFQWNCYLGKYTKTSFTARNTSWM